jgi:NADPH-dependent glutamate synthase beta subunit-like oxidoreductase
MLVTAIGQGPDMSFVEKDNQIKDMKLTRWSTVDADPEILQSNIPHVFAAGDAYTGASLVVEAIGGGRRAARAIHLFLEGEELEPVPDSLLKKHIPESLFDKVKGVTAKHRAEMPELPVDERIKCFDEADLVLAEEDALAESNRCLACCRLCYNPDLTDLVTVEEEQEETV